MKQNKTKKKNQFEWDLDTQNKMLTWHEERLAETTIKQNNKEKQARNSQIRQTAARNMAKQKRRQKASCQLSDDQL